MRQSVLFFIFFAISYIGGGVGMLPLYGHSYQGATNLSDSLDLFRDITDIRNQVKRSVNQDTPDPPTVVPQAIFQPIDTNRFEVQKTKTRPVIYLPPVNPLDSVYSRKPNGTLLLPPVLYNSESMRGLTFRDTLFYDPLFLPMIFTGEMLPRDLSFYPPKDTASLGFLIPQEKTFAPQLRHLDFVKSVRRQYYIDHPDQMKYSVAYFDSIPPIIRDAEVKESFNPLRELIKPQSTFSLDAPNIEGVQIGRKYWVFSGDHSLQFSQYFFSENWYKGGTNYVNIFNKHILKADYAKDKVKFNNSLEWRLSLSTAPDDTLRNYRIGDDMIRYYGNLGIDAFLKKWSYSMNTEIKSQLFNNYPVNKNDLISALLAPLYVNAGIGMRYELNKSFQSVRHRQLNLTIDLAPISVNYKLIANDKVDIARYGIPEGKNSLLELGSTITSNFKFKYNQYITWTSRFKYFTSYENVLAEFENTLDMKLSNYFSTSVYLYLRFDDGVPPNEKYKYLQVNQSLTFGLNYKW
ncbi:DUF3078 domain-containing protein [Limibacterium fermenti]|uniref:DUF3078 domain-containing protein n=1 Tax=Limibacterium fermenti TaxID=3229863 RepID=UPI003A637033